MFLAVEIMSLGEEMMFFAECLTPNVLFGGARE